MNITRQSDDATYQLQKLAWELVQSKGWKDFLKPMLQEKTAIKLPALLDISSAFQLSRQQGACDFAQYLLGVVESRADSFTRRQ